MTRWIPLLALAAGLVPIPTRAAELLVPGRSETYAYRDFGGLPLPSYQSGYVASVNQSMSAYRIDHVTEGPKIQQSLDPPETFQYRVDAVAVSFDQRVAVSAGAMDREGRLTSVLAWFRMDGSLIRFVRTWPFTAGEIGFTADGSLWAIGVEKLEDLTENPVHHVMRQYGPDGTLIRSLLPRSSLSTGRHHPTEGALLLTSQFHAAVISPVAGLWTVVTTQGVEISEGSLALPPGFQIVLGGITDSGRLFVEGHWENAALRGSFPPITVFEIRQASSALELVQTGSALPTEAFGMLLGSEGEDLVFHVSSRGQGSRLVWTRAR